MQLEEIRPEDFEPLLGSYLELRAGALTLATEVLALKRLPSHRLRAHPPFALVLRGGREPTLGQGMVVLAHPTLGALEFFAVPLGQDTQGMRYEITFN